MVDINFATLQSGKEYFIRMEIEKCFGRWFGLDTKEVFKLVTTRVVEKTDSRELTIEKPFNKYAKLLLTGKNSIDEVELAALYRYKKHIIPDLSKWLNTQGMGVFEKLTNMFYIQKKGMRGILDETTFEVQEVKEAIYMYRRFLNKSINTEKAHLLELDNGAFFELNISPKTRNVLFEFGIKTITDLNMAFYFDNNLLKKLRSNEIDELTLALSGDSEE